MIKWDTDEVIQKGSFVSSGELFPKDDDKEWCKDKNFMERLKTISRHNSDVLYRTIFPHNRFLG
jgi:hypothetical protein